MQKISIAIDGHSSTGKSTVARQLAESLGYVYIDSGAMYRAVTLFALQQGLIGESLDRDGLIRELGGLTLAFAVDPETGSSQIELNGKNVEGKIRTLEVSRHVSEVAAIPEVREKLVKLQQQMGRHKGVVMDGRDIGTVVLPQAELKIFMTASPEIRASRRYRELQARGEAITYAEVLENVRHRDYLDSHREVSPLIQAKDAILLDNSEIGLEEQFQRIQSYVEQTLQSE